MSSSSSPQIASMNIGESINCFNNRRAFTTLFTVVAIALLTLKMIGHEEHGTTKKDYGPHICAGLVFCTNAVGRWS